MSQGAVLGTLEIHGFDIGFEPATLTVDQPGRYVVKLANDGVLPHDITFCGAVGLFVGGMLLSLPAFDTGIRLGGAGMVALCLWLARYDIARRTVRRTGLTCFITVALLAGYVWLGGLLALWFGGVLAGPAYDAMLHAVFVGFVISMVFGHAPIIFPAVLRVAIPFDRSCYAPLVLLHLSLLLRIGGDLAAWSDGRRYGALLNAVALVLFLGNTVWLARTAARSYGAEHVDEPRRQSTVQL